MADAVQPPIRSDGLPSRGDPREGAALCLSGGGYRAMLFHLGAIWRLNEAGVLGTLTRVSSSSGGSITAAALGRAWNSLGWENGVAPNFEKEVVWPVRALASTTVDAPAILAGIFLPGSGASWAARIYDRRLFHGATMQDLPATPQFVLNATNVQTGSLFRFTRDGIRDWRVGEVARPTLPLAHAVAASAAFPPFLSPMRLRFREQDWNPERRGELHRPPYTTDVYLTDAAVYDNLALEAVWKRYDTIFVSDACGRVSDEARPRTDWVGHFVRVAELVNSQIHFLRKRQLIGSFACRSREGAYWAVGSHVEDYGLSDSMECPPERTFELETVPTRLAAMPEDLQERLINWGYAICDTALRRWYKPSLPRPQRFPYSRGV